MPSLQSKNWVFTLNQVSDKKLIPFSEFYEVLKKIKDVESFVFQEEKVNCSHYQGTLRLSKKSTFVTLKCQFTRFGFGHIHFERARGTPEQCMRYCTKVDSRVAGPWCFPDHYINSFGQLSESRFKRRKVVSSSWSYEDVRGPNYCPERVLCAGSSGIGKTTIFNLIFAYAGFSVYEVPPRNRNSNGRWISSYKGEQAVIIDEFSYDDFTQDMWKMILDPIPHKLPASQGGKSVNWYPYYVVCLCNDLRNVSMMISDSAIERRCTEVIDWTDKLMPERSKKTRYIGPNWDH